MAGAQSESGACAGGDRGSAGFAGASASGA